MAGEFFGNVADAIASTGVRVGSGGPPTDAVLGPGAGSSPVRRPARSSPPRRAPRPSQQDFLKGIAVGAGLVLLGVVAGGLFGRRRR